MSTSGEAAGPMPGGPSGIPGGPPAMPAFNPNPSKGLQPLIIALLYLCPGIAGVIVLVRIIKKRIDRTLGGDDALIVLGWLLCIGNSVIIHFYTLTIHSGYHDEDFNPMEIDWVRALKLQWALGAEYNPIIAVVKMSFLWSLQRLNSPNKNIRKSLWAIQIINGVYMIVSTFVALIPCIPLHKKWHPEVPGHCMDGGTYVLGVVSVVLITDVMVLVMPSWIIWDLQMPLRRKLVTISFLSLGFIVIGVGIARLIWLHNAFVGIAKSYTVESTYSAIESSVAIIGASGPTVKYMLSFCIPKLKTAPVNSKRSGYEHNNSAPQQLSAGKRSDNARSRKPTDAYDDLNTFNVENERYEMNNGWNWANKKDSDARSDEQEITKDINDTHGGIYKTVDVTISSRENGNDSERNSKSQIDIRTAVRPIDVV